MAQETFDIRQQKAFEECLRLINHFTRKSKKGKSNFQFYKYTSIILATLITIVSSMELFYGSIIPGVVIPILGALAALFTTFLSVTKSQKIWADSRTTSQKLAKEKFLYTQHADMYAEPDEEKRLSLFSKNIMSIWSDGHEKWESTINEI